jgi:hypothetical protein
VHASVQHRINTNSPSFAYTPDVKMWAAAILRRRTVITAPDPVDAHKISRHRSQGDGQHHVRQCESFHGRYSSCPRVWVDAHGSIWLFDPDSPLSRSATARRWIGAHLVNMVSSWPAAPDNLLDRLDGIDVGDRFLAGSADAVDAGNGRDQARVRVSPKTAIKLPTCLGSMVNVPSSCLVRKQRCPGTSPTMNTS